MMVIKCLLILFVLCISGCNKSLLTPSSPIFAIEITGYIVEVNGKFMYAKTMEQATEFLTILKSDINFPKDLITMSNTIIFNNNLEFPGYPEEIVMKGILKAKKSGIGRKVGV